MKRLTLIVLLLLVGCDKHHKLPLQVSSLGQSSGPLVLIVAGQSNGASGAQGTQGPIASVTGHVTIHDLSTSFDGVPSPSNLTGGSVSWVYLGDMLYSTFGRSSVIWNIARGNTSSTQWVQNNWYRQIGQLAQSQHATAVLWIQGESNVGMTADQTYADMRRMIDESHRLASNLVWFIAIDGYANPNTADAQRRLIGEGYARQGPDIDLMRQTNPQWFTRGLFNGPGNYAAGAEFTDIEGYTAHALRWFDVLRGIASMG